MQTFYKETKSEGDIHLKESMQTKPQREQDSDLQPLTPQFLHIPFRQHSQILQDCLVRKASPEDDSVWKLIDSGNYWLALSDIYFPPIDTLNFDDLILFRQANCPPITKTGKGFPKQTPEHKQNKEMHDSVFVAQSKILARQKGLKLNCSIDQLIDIWEQQLVTQQARVDSGVFEVQASIAKSRAQLQRLEGMLRPANYRPDLVHFQYMELEDIEARKSQEEIQRRNGTRVVCCVCNLEEMENSSFITCSDCNNTLHDKCYVLSVVQPQQSFKCWSCANPPTEDDGDSCALCYVKGGVMGASELRSDNTLIENRFHPSVSYYIKDQNTQSGSDSNILTLGKYTRQTTPSGVFQTRVHLSCAFWHPECFFSKSSQQFQGLLKMKDRKWKLECRVCELPCGASIECGSHGCSKSFHVECARKGGIQMSVAKIGKVQKQILCQKHRIKHAFQKLVDRRYQNLMALRRLYRGIQRILGYQGLTEKKPRKKELKALKSKARGLLTETNDHSGRRFCLCKSLYKGQKMIECERCFDWFHFECVQVPNPLKFVCPMCKPRC